MEALKFREMPYERPDGEALKTSMRTLTEKLRAAGSYDAAKAVFLEKETLSKHIQTLATLAQVRHTIDTRDKFYDERTASGTSSPRSWRSIRRSGRRRCLPRRTARTLKRNTAR